MRRIVSGTLILIIAILAVISVPAIVSAEGTGEGRVPLSPGSLQNITNRSQDPGALPAEYRPGPSPVTIYRAELNQSTLPGPRYMAFGPSVIGLSLDPRLLALLFTLVIVCLAIWFVAVRKKGVPDDEGKPGEK